MIHTSKFVENLQGKFNVIIITIIIIIIIIIPLTNELNRADCGYQVHGTERRISRLLYMDDLKLLGRNENELKNEMKIVQTVSKDINMNFGLKKNVQE